MAIISEIRWHQILTSNCKTHAIHTKNEIAHKEE